MKSLTILLLLLSIPVLSLPAFAATLTLRGGVAVEQSGDTTVADRDCTSTAPPALFGCGIDARGDLGSVHAFDLAVGTSSPRARIELAFTHRDLALAASANFTGVRGPQPVRADGTSRALMVNGYWSCPHGDLQPFVFAGAGLARNELEAVTYGFPSIGANAVTITRGGASQGFAWNAGAGVSLRMSESLFVDVALRYTDLGDFETDAGPAQIIRPTRTLLLDIDGTRATAETAGVAITLRWVR
ncbi:MAG TPA: outer membrane beta-barrel protein [Thermoanaerobaculia bacterium]|nr:outer membrane beta-barrel protein [Thermoanaerobaculia bacterium]